MFLNGCFVVGLFFCFTNPISGSQEKNADTDIQYAHINIGASLPLLLVADVRGAVKNYGIVLGNLDSRNNDHVFSCFGLLICVLA